uniref:C-type lectin domain-containing protein n=1 Tax=Oreochromis niloticus TaxID=8128 RepID=A0A669BPT0_ORENI
DGEAAEFFYCISFALQCQAHKSSLEKTCPTRWSKFCCSCYLLSERSGSWDSDRKHCTDQGADLVVIDSPKEQVQSSCMFYIKRTWIGLNDIEQEGTWKWVDDGTPLTLTYWGRYQPDNGGEEDCVHVGRDKQKSWNDLSCSSSYQWICEKVPENN